MCHYVSLILSDPAKERAYTDVLASHKRRLTRYENRSLAAHLKSDEFLAYPAGKYCDCGTELGSIKGPLVGRIARSDIEKLSRKGWTETKIQRWIEQKKKVEARNERVHQVKRQYLESGNADPDGWIGAVSKMLDVANASYVGLLLHWYSGSLESERIPLKGRQNVSIGDGASQALFAMNEDEIYKVYR